MFGNLDALMKLRNAWGTFSSNHPKFAAFLQEIGRSGAQEGTVVDISVEYPDGKKISSNMRLTPSDLELIESLRKLANK